MPALEQSNAIKCYEHRDSLATAMSVDYTGQWVLLAGRRNLALQKLDGDGTLRKFYRSSKYEVSAAEFAICSNRQEFCAIATTEHIDIVTWGAAEPRHFFSLRGHTRTVTDIDWHGKNPNLLVSCSIDTFSHIWDLREPRKPFLSLSAVCMSGATQVGFNRVSGNLLAAAHDGDLRIWDIRKGSCPTHYITAHSNRVHGINWSHLRETCLATASQDKTVKYFDINNPRDAEKIITTNSPVWRARYTPIGNGLVSINVPHLGRGENSLLLWSNSKQTDPICSFVGHTDVILDFAWRPNRDNQTNTELVTWSRDRSLRVWKIDETMLKLCEPDSDTSGDTQDLNDTFHADTTMKHHYHGFGGSSSEQQSLSTPSSLSPYHQPNMALPVEGVDALQIHLSCSPPPRVSGSLSTVQQSSRAEKQAPLARSLTDQPTCSLHHEFSLLNTNMHVEVDVLNAIRRYSLFKISAGGHLAILEINFPTEYPSPNIIPNFKFCEGSTIPNTGVLLKVLKTTALQKVKKSRNCLEQCLRALVAAMKKVSLEDFRRISVYTGVSHKLMIASEKSEKLMRLQSPRLEGQMLSGACMHDACIPFPRSSSCQFNPTGMLVIFAQTLSTKRLTLARQQNNITPRALSAINGLLCNMMGPQPVLYRDSNASFYRMNSKSHSKTRSLSNKSATLTTPIVLVHIYEAHNLLHINRDLAIQYSLEKSNIVKTCEHNRKICEAIGRYDLSPIWSLAEMIAKPNIPDESKYEMFFYKDPFKKLLLEALIMHFATSGDLQTAVVLSCLFHKGNSTSMDLDVLHHASSSNTTSYSSKLSLKLTPITSPYHTVLPIDNHASKPKANAISVATMKSVCVRSKQLRSNSWSDSQDPNPKIFHADAYSCSLIRRSKMPLFDNFKYKYADILFGWKLLTVRAQILKHTMYTKSLTQQGIDFVAECSGCKKTKRTAACGPCKRPVLFCTLCSLPVKGEASTCLACCHGGHLSHMLQWFKTHSICATGCGCECLKESALILERID